MTFHVGQKVVCINAIFSKPGHDALARDLGIIMPTKGSIYTVREIVRDFFPGKEHIRLQEIKNTVVDWIVMESCEPAYSIGRFRPVVENKTDISVFTDLLLPTKEFING